MRDARAHIEFLAAAKIVLEPRLHLGDRLAIEAERLAERKLFDVELGQAGVDERVDQLDRVFDYGNVFWRRPPTRPELYMRVSIPA